MNMTHTISSVLMGMQNQGGSGESTQVDGDLFKGLFDALMFSQGKEEAMDLLHKEEAMDLLHKEEELETKEEIIEEILAFLMNVDLSVEGTQALNAPMDPAKVEAAMGEHKDLHTRTTNLLETEALQWHNLKDLVVMIKSLGTEDGTPEALKSLLTEAPTMNALQTLSKEELELIQQTLATTKEARFSLKEEGGRVEALLEPTGTQKALENGYTLNSVRSILEEKPLQPMKGSANEGMSRTLPKEETTVDGVQGFSMHPEGVLKSQGEISLKDGLLPKELAAEQLQKLEGEVIHSIQTLKDGEKTTMKMRLYPEELGEIEVVLTMDKGKLTGQFQLDNKEMKMLFQERLQELTQTLKAQNIQVQSLEVTSSMDDGQSGQKEQGQFMRELIDRQGLLSVRGTHKIEPQKSQYQLGVETMKERIDVLA